jgi:pimeloyl-ACP methyl ester carboxylesterase
MRGSMALTPSFSDITFTVRDGLRLHVRYYPANGQFGHLRRPVICLPGLTRNGRDFHDLANALSSRSGEERDVYAFDYRGRGLSEFDPEWRNYNVPAEALDVIDFVTMRNLAGAAIIGTSRGGLIAMVMAALQPSVMGPVVLNDIGPVIERDGLARISAYVGRIPVPGTWPEAARLVRDMNKRAFPSAPDSVWEKFARQWFNEKSGRPAPGFDAKIGNTLSVLDGPMPALWSQFACLKRHPLLVLRGEHSDILSAATVDEMRRRTPVFADHVVKGEGHAPLLMDPTSIDIIAGFLASSDTYVYQPLREIA